MSSRFWARDFPTQASAVKDGVYVSTHGDHAAFGNIADFQDKSGRLTDDELLDWHLF